jgi:hypothetical protein
MELSMEDPVALGLPDQPTSICDIVREDPLSSLLVSWGAGWKLHPAHPRGLGELTLGP